MGKTIRKFSKKRKQTQNKRKTKGRKPIRRKSVRHSRKRGGNTEITYEDMKPAYEILYEVECAAKALDDTEKVKEILEKLSSDGKGSCIRAYTNRVTRGLYRETYQYSVTEKECELLKQKQYFKASILGQLIDLEENIMEEIKEKIYRKGIDGSIDSETKKQAYAELIFIRMYTLILKKIKTEYDCRNIYRNKYNELKDRFSYGMIKEKPTMKETIDKVIEEHKDCKSIYQKMIDKNQKMRDNIGKDDKENEVITFNEVISFNADEIEVGDVEEVKHDNILQKLKDLFHRELNMELGELNRELGESEINEYFNTLFDNAFDLAELYMIKVQEYDLTLNRKEKYERGLIIDYIDTTTAELIRPKILNNNMQITHLTHTRISDLIYKKKDGTYGLRPIPNQPPNSEI